MKRNPPIRVRRQARGAFRPTTSRPPRRRPRSPAPATSSRVERDDVGAIARREPAEPVRQPEKGGRRGARQTQRLGQTACRAGGRSCAPRSPCRAPSRRGRRPVVAQRRRAPRSPCRTAVNAPPGAADRRHRVGDQHRLALRRAAPAAASPARHARRRRSARKTRAVSSSAAAIGPGARADSGRIALNRWVKPVSPSANAARVWS